MRFGLVHRIMTDALAALGVLAVVSTASLGLATNVTLLVGLALALAVPESWSAKPWMRHLSTAAPLVLFIVEAVRLLAGESVLEIAVEFAALLQVLRVATRRGAAHDQQIIVLALLHLVAGTVLGGGLAYGLCFLGFLVVAPGALVLSHLRREVEGNYRQGARDRTGLPVDVPRILRSRRVVGRGFLGATCLISVPIFLFTATLFLLFPRVGLSLLLLNHSRSGRLVGFSDRVDLGNIGVLRSDPSVALRFTVPDAKEPPAPRMVLRLRGTAFDVYDGRAWKRTHHERPPAQPHAGSHLYKITRLPTEADRRISFDLEPIDPPVVFLPPGAVAIELKPQNQAVFGDRLNLATGPEGELRYSGTDAHGVRYDVFLARDGERASEPLPDRARYLSLAESSLPTRVGDLAREWTRGETSDYRKAKIIEEKLRTQYRYDLGSPSGGTSQPVDHFLFESRRGHCEFFSTAMALMLRTVNVPTRNVTGFVGGTYNRFGRYYAVREGDAHSWIEAYIADDPSRPGWYTFDPTPPSAAQPLTPNTGAWVYVRDLLDAMSQRWNRYVVGYDMRTQMRLFDAIERRYSQLRKRAGIDRGPLERITRGPVVAAVLLGASVFVYFWWKRRQRGERSEKQAPTEKPNDRAIEAATTLYRLLEVALSAQGIPRPTSLPPLKHAEELASRSHPLSDEVLKLTQRYLEARFGEAPLSEDETRTFERRVREIRATKLPEHLQVP